MSEIPREKTTAIKATETVKKVRGMVKAMNQRAHEARAQGQPIAYCFVNSLYSEIIRAMDIVPVWTENWAGVCAAKREAERFLLKAHADGFSNNLCTYATCGLGFDIMRDELGYTPSDSPDGGMEKPDMMLGAGMDACDPRHKWYQAVQRYMDVPIHVTGVLWPPCDSELKDVEDYYASYLTEELRKLVEFLERVTGRKMDWDRMNHVIDLSDKANRLLWETYQLRKSMPCPMPTGDAMSAMVPNSFLGGTQEAVDFYQELHDEVKHRVDNKIGVISNEKYRLIWASGLPPWHSLMLFNYFETLGAVFAIEATYRPWDLVDVPKEVTHPLERLAWRQLKRLTYRHERAKKNSGNHEVELIIEMIDNYNIDAVVMHRAFSCRQVHTGQLHLLNVLKRYRNLPSLILESDIVDVRSFDKAEAENKVDAFIEMVEASKKANQ
ncbi:2-hydroxyacyl-CoA dehydratase subunit D [Chloroflexota bacterium]